MNMVITIKATTEKLVHDSWITCVSKTQTPLQLEVVDDANLITYVHTYIFYLFDVIVYLRFNYYWGFWTLWINLNSLINENKDLYLSS